MVWFNKQSPDLLIVFLENVKNPHSNIYRFYIAKGYNSFIRYILAV